MKVVKARIKINRKGFHTRDSGYMEATPNNTAHLCLCVYVTSKRAWTSPWNVNLLRVTKQTQHKKSRNPLKLDKNRAWESPICVCPVAQLHMTSLYGHCWEKDATTEKPSEPMGTVLQPGQVSFQFELMECRVYTGTTCWHHFAPSSRGLPGVHYRFYNELFRNAECQNPKKT